MKLPLFLTFIVIASCATRPPAEAELRTVREEKIYKKLSGESKLTVTRDSGFIGSACSIGLLINDEIVVGLDPAERFQTSLPPGEYKIGVSSDKNSSAICSGWISKNREFVIKAQSEKKLRIFIDPNGIPDIFPE